MLLPQALWLLNTLLEIEGLSDLSVYQLFESLSRRLDNWMAESDISEPAAKKAKEDPITYLENAPIAFRETADCILRLDSGERLPVHKQILSLKSEVFCSLLLSSDLSEDDKQTEVPLEDCTLGEANNFLRYIYMREPITDEYQAEGLTKLAHKFNVKMALDHCDAYLAKRAADNPGFLQMGTATTRSVLDWAVMANTYHLQKFLARCELFIMKHFHTNPSSKTFIAALSPESQLRIYRGCAEARPMCMAICQTCGRTLQEGKSFHISKALASCGKDGCTGCVKARAVMTDFPSEEAVEAWQNTRQLAPAAVAQVSGPSRRAAPGSSSSPAPAAPAEAASSAPPAPADA